VLQKGREKEGKKVIQTISVRHGIECKEEASFYIKLTLDIITKRNVLANPELEI